MNGVKNSILAHTDHTIASTRLLLDRLLLLPDDLQYGIGIDIVETCLYELQIFRDGITDMEFE